MKTYKKLVALNISFFSLIACTCSNLFGQSSIEIPQSPKMPSISSPAIGKGFYTPGSQEFYTGNIRVPNSLKTNKKNNLEDNKSQNQATQKANYNSINQIKSLSSNVSNFLTANDISTLNNLGMFGNISSLIEQNQPSISNSITDKSLLNKILQELSDLKESVNSQSSIKSDNNENSSSILRFTINGNNILPTCKEIFFSNQESDGTFLLTGDRKYSENNKTFSETFYFLFKAKGSKNSSLEYSVTPILNQTSNNSSSPLAILASQKDLTATKIGNLVTFKISNNKINLDLLLSIQ
ncbi:MAG: hypothetical protein J6B63_04980 [Treponema sp.]|nr:hypothetical protein [Treponema sp.]